MPAHGSWTADFNQVGLDSEALRQQLEASGSDHVAYRQNRAVIFVSDRFHASQPFEFGAGSPRVNLTLLFGDRKGRPQP